MFPKLNDVTEWLYAYGFEDIAENILKAYIVGSVAKKTNTPESDLDIAVILPDDLLDDDLLDVNTDILNAIQHEITWNGQRVDIQVFYETDPRLKEYSKILLKASTQARLIK